METGHTHTTKARTDLGHDPIYTHGQWAVGSRAGRSINKNKKIEYI